MNYPLAKINNLGGKYLGLAIFVVLTLFIVGFILNYENAQAAEGTIYFDVQPRTIQGGQTAQFIFRVTLSNRDCGPIENNLRWVISRKIGNGPFGAFQSGEVPLNSFIDNFSKALSFPKPLFSVPTGINWTFSAKIYCGVAIPSIISTSSDVPVTVSGGSTGGGTQMIYGCVANDSKFACSPSNISTCADAPACTGKTCVEIDRARCGQSSSTTPITGGSDQPLSWRITNPLVGNPQNVLEAVLLIINWLANIAGSLIVIMIIYGGVKFLLSRGNPGEVGKAKTILTWALIGMAVVLIGKGFVFIVDGILRNQVPLP